MQYGAYKNQVKFEIDLKFSSKDTIIYLNNLNMGVPDIVYMVSIVGGSVCIMWFFRYVYFKYQKKKEFENEKNSDQEISLLQDVDFMKLSWI